MVRQGASHMCDGSAHSSGRVVNGLMLCMRMREGYCSWCVSVCPLVYTLTLAQARVKQETLMA